MENQATELLSQVSRTAGQIGYEAYCADTDWKSLVSGAQLPEWSALNPRIRQAWEVAARAVQAVK